MELAISTENTKIKSIDYEGQKLPKAADLIESLIGISNGRRKWLETKRRIPAILKHVVSVKERGGSVDYLTSKAFAILISDLKTQKVAGQETLRSIRTCAMDIAARYYTADPTLVHEVIDKIDNVEALERIAQRAQLKATNKMLTDSIKECNGSGWGLYASINDTNNIAVTGEKAKQIVKARAPKGKKNSATRDYFTIEEMVNMQFLEFQEQRSLKKHKADGNTAIKAVCKDVIGAFTKLNEM